jgi:hypothetical protein
MNMFSDAARRRAEEAARRPANETEIARDICQQINQYVATAPATPTVQVDHERNVARLFRPNTDRMFQITCLADGTFHVDENGRETQRVVTYNLPRTYTIRAPTSEDKMIEEVLAWMQ